MSAVEEYKARLRQLEELVFEQIRIGGAMRFCEILSKLGIAVEYRAVDRALQRLRKAGRVAFQGGRWRVTS